MIRGDQTITWQKHTDCLAQIHLDNRDGIREILHRNNGRRWWMIWFNVRVSGVLTFAIFLRLWRFFDLLFYNVFSHFALFSSPTGRRWEIAPKTGPSFFYKVSGCKTPKIRLKISVLILLSWMKFRLPKDTSRFHMVNIIHLFVSPHNYSILWLILLRGRQRWDRPNFFVPWIWFPLLGQCLDDKIHTGTRIVDPAEVNNRMSRVNSRSKAQTRITDWVVGKS